MQMGKLHGAIAAATERLQALYRARSDLVKGKRAKKERSWMHMKHSILRHDAEKLISATVERADAAAEIKVLDEETGCLADLLEKHTTDKRKQDFEIQLLKGDLKIRKTFPWGVPPPDPSSEELKEKREREVEKKRKDVSGA